MHLANVVTLSNVINTPTGEIIYPLFDASTGATRHSVARVIIPPEKGSPKHYHKISEETYFIYRGRAVLTINGQTYHLSAHQGVLINPGDVHQIFNACGENLELLVTCAPLWT